MADNKIYLRQNIRPKVELWSNTFEISVTEFVHEALTHYIRFLSGKPTGSNLVQLPVPEADATGDQLNEENDDSDYDGGFVL